MAQERATLGVDKMKGKKGVLRNKNRVIHDITVKNPLQERGLLNKKRTVNYKCGPIGSMGKQKRERKGACPTEKKRKT